MQAKPSSETDFQVRTNFHGNNKFTIKEDHFKPYSKHHLDLGALVNMLDETDIYHVGDNNGLFVTLLYLKFINVYSKHVKENCYLLQWIKLFSQIKKHC